MRPILATGVLGAHAVAPAVAAAGPTAGEAEELAAATTAFAEDEIARVTSEAAAATAPPAAAPSPPPPPSSPPPSSVPRLGRFEALRGALSFMAPREWVLGPSCAPSALRGAVLVFRRSGDVELREGGGGGAVVAEGASPWKYAQSTDGDRTLGVTFTLDAPTVADDVLVFDATLDLAEGVLAGGVFTGRAEIGARGAGPMKRVGRFDATLR